MIDAPARRLAGRPGGDRPRGHRQELGTAARRDRCRPSSRSAASRRSRRSGTGRSRSIDDPAEAAGALRRARCRSSGSTTRRDVVPGRPDLLEGARNCARCARTGGRPDPLGRRLGAGHRAGLQGAALRDRLHPSRPDRVRRRALRRRRRPGRDDAGRADPAGRPGHHPHPAARRARAADHRADRRQGPRGDPRACSASSASSEPRIAVAGPQSACRRGRRRSAARRSTSSSRRSSGCARKASTSAARIRPTSCSTSAGARSYDAALCMYHDQALIPLKTLHFDEGVNVTLGLPIVRTSPDHGTAFDIAGQRHAPIRAR